MHFGMIRTSIPFIVEGIGVTLEFALVSAILGFILGVILSLFKISHIKVLKWFADAYTSVFRGTPLILQLFIIYYATPELTGWDIPTFLAGVLAFGLNSGAYMSEIIRAGINAVDKGQIEASQALGIAYWPMMKDVILPQAIRNILPAMMNEFITLTKESAIISTISALDLMRRADLVANKYYLFFEPYLIALVLYYIIVMILTILGRMLERRLSHSD